MKLFCKVAIVVFTLTFIMAVSDTSAEDLNKMRLPCPSELPQNELPTGAWGGKHISLEITANGGSVEFDCAHGTIEGKIKLDRQGQFSVKGTYVEEHSGPVRQSDKASSYAVLYTGQIKDGKMKLTVKRSNNKTPVGTFTLTRGQEAFIVKCR